MNVNSSILTNTQSMTALRTLNQTKGMLGQTQDRISTGLKIGGAKDGPSTFTIAQTMRGDVAGFKKVSENIGLSQTLVGVAADNTERVSSLVNEIKGEVTSAQNAAKPTQDVQKDIDQKLNQIKSIVAGAQFKGVNLINNSETTEVLGSIDRVAQTGQDSVAGNMIDVQNQDLEVARGGGLQVLDGLSVVGVLGASQTVNDDLSGTGSSTLTVGSSDVGVGKELVIKGVVGGTNEVQMTLRQVSDSSISNGDVLSDGAIAVQMGSGSTAITAATGATSLAAQIQTALTTASGSMPAGFDTGAGTGTLGITAATGGTITIAEGDASDTVTGFEEDFDFDTVLNRVEQAQETVLDASSEFGSVQQRLDDQQSFVKSLSDSVETGIGQLVDANMAEEASRLQALQAQEQLGTQALSIANRSPQSLLSLFG